MPVQTIYKFQLDTSSKKVICPGCHQRRAVRYKDSETGEFFPDIVVRCDRENSCGYHYTPKQYFTETGVGYSATMAKEEDISEKEIDYMPLDYVQKSMTGFDKTNFALYLISLFRYDTAAKALLKYFVGRSKNDN